jgi:prepilin-type N-terminal cleavage/methylation domain-containing protein
MRKAFTLIELMIVIAIIAIICAIAIPQLMANKDAFKPGTQVRAKVSGVIVTIIQQDQRTAFLYLCRIDNGPEAKVRFVEARFQRDELEPLPEADKTQLEK